MLKRVLTAAVAAAALAALVLPASAEETGPDKWAGHKGDLPFIVGSEKGTAEAKFTGKPPMYFFTTTW